MINYSHNHATRDSCLMFHTFYCQYLAGSISSDIANTTLIVPCVSPSHIPCIGGSTSTDVTGIARMSLAMVLISGCLSAWLLQYEKGSTLSARTSTEAKYLSTCSSPGAKWSCQQSRYLEKQLFGSVNFMKVFHSLVAKSFQSNSCKTSASATLVLRAVVSL